MKKMMRWIRATVRNLFFWRERSYATSADTTTAAEGEAFPDCTHGAVTTLTTIKVLGHDLEFAEMPMCVACSTDYLNKVSTLCGVCEEPIIPGMRVGIAHDGAKHPYTHLNMGCCVSGALFCGAWGEGRLVSLHELNPEQFPDDTSCVAEHALKTGGPVVVNLR
jgi:hypothetical protein